MSELVQEAVKNLEAKAEAAVKAVEGEVEKKVEEVKEILISAEEKLVIREVENTFLKSRLEINRLEKQAEEAQRKFPAIIEGLKNKYKVDPAIFLFDSNKLAFIRKPQ